MVRRQINLRISDTTEQQLDDLRELGYTVTTAVTVALDRMWHQECRKENEMDWQTESGCYEGPERNRQVGVLRDMAANIAFGSDDPSCPVAERVDYYIENEIMPPWFDDHDRELLIEFVGDD